MGNAPCTRHSDRARNEDIREELGVKAPCTRHSDRARNEDMREELGVKAPCTRHSDRARNEDIREELGVKAPCTRHSDRARNEDIREELGVKAPCTRHSDRARNEDIREELGVKKSMEERLMSLSLRWFGHGKEWKTQEHHMMTWEERVVGVTSKVDGPSLLLQWPSAPYLTLRWVPPQPSL
uniref:Uncharacterized protein n=1 Tax=Timema tahoe TaxID=61484 RepID=A0A7R9IMT5_9NEOP|nr:unnamed protein product [Timema tahoe]